MKRKSFQSISTILLGLGTLISGLCTAPLTYAYDVAASGVDPSLLPDSHFINGRNYWTVPEMLEASELVNAKRSEFCEGDPMCEEDLVYEQAEYFGGIYHALEPFDHIHLMLTSINPSLGSMKLLYRDEDKMLSRMTGETFRADLESIYMVWVEESLGDPSTDARWLAYGYRYPYTLGTEEEAKAASHIVMDESASELGARWFTPNTEREYNIKDSRIELNTSGLIYFSYVANNAGSSSGFLNYSGCINSPDYREGMECRIMFHDGGYYDMIPMEPLADVSPSVSNEPSIVKTVNRELPTEEQIDSGFGGATTLATVETNQKTESGNETTTSQKIVNAPNTGAATNNAESNQDETTPQFPWWLVSLMFFGSIFFIFSWWFILPLFQRKRQQ